jgi:hypothetical protein
MALALRSVHSISFFLSVWLGSRCCWPASGGDLSRLDGQATCGYGSVHHLPYHWLRAASKPPVAMTDCMHGEGGQGAERTAADACTLGWQLRRRHMHGRCLSLKAACIMLSTPCCCRPYAVRLVGDRKVGCCRGGCRSQGVPASDHRCGVHARTR